MIDIVNFINGRHVKATSGDRLFSINPSTEERIAQFNVSSSTDVDSAVYAARIAYEQGSWPRLTVEERASYLHMIADVLEDNLSLFAQYECEDTGFLSKMCLHGHLPRAVEHFRFFAEEGKRFFGSAIPIGNSYINFTHNVPVGVVAIMTPWNGPLSVSSINLAAALIAGNTVVLKPSELAPITVSLLGQIIAEIGLPEGVVNIVHGAGQPTGEALIRHADIDLLCFVGGTQVGKDVLRYSSGTLRRSLLELGGKSPTVVLADADIDAALDGALVSAFSSNGQVCTAGSRIIVDKTIAKTFSCQFIERTQNIRVGDPFDGTSEIGPMISASHRENILKAITQAQQEGASLCAGGIVPMDCYRGFYIEPAVLTGVHPQSSLATQEIFGPVVAIFIAENEEHALSLANDSKFGLAGTVWSTSDSKALSFARKMQAGNIGINTPYIRDIRCPFGGFKQSGIGTVGGYWSLEQYTQTQTLCLPLNSYTLPRYGALK
ncbi:aldehyde dehydrogenase family protein [Xenorhabdus anantnagensis]|uniref:Aldehyde dehydrogenase family protein n=1 Tax=Xenorhabdus anantnagensis TaxID=3025875 RepID=A0ABT5LWJ2_9GAMM|nr:aldehyde dehydrogenase family protein [Xenorhabdus anantnagensis]MDC9598811.1 aldehyde dehydrogenase family protein [Xenorhabdus anantnagensis]